MFLFFFDLRVLGIVDEANLQHTSRGYSRPEEVMKSPFGNPPDPWQQGGSINTY